MKKKYTETSNHPIIYLFLPCNFKNLFLILIPAPLSLTGNIIMSIFNLCGRCFYPMWHFFPYTYSSIQQEELDVDPQTRWIICRKLEDLQQKTKVHDTTVQQTVYISFRYLYWAESLPTSSNFLVFLQHLHLDNGIITVTFTGQKGVR